MENSESVRNVLDTIRPATAGSFNILYERACERKNPPRNDVEFLDYVVERGIAEIERAWKTQEKTADRNAMAKKYLDTVKFLKSKQAHGEELTEAQLEVLRIFQA